LQVIGVKAKFRGFFLGALAIAAELALYYPASLLDAQIDRQIRMHLGSVPGWVDWLLHGLVWATIFIGPIVAYFGFIHLRDKRRRRQRFAAALDESARSTVRVAGTWHWSEFRADEALALVVPDAVAAIDKTRGLLRLKAISWAQDIAIDLSHVIGVTWRPGETRAARGRQSFFRRFNPKYRTLSEHPAIRLQIATQGLEPVLEYELMADPRDRKALERFHALLRRVAGGASTARLVATQDLLDVLPMQGSKYGYGWIETA
jgi:hypothetical protein